MAKRPTTIKALCKRHGFTIDEWERPEDSLLGYALITLILIFTLSQMVERAL